MPRNRIVIFHYHLNPGGVTRIIESQIETLRQHDSSADILVVCGDCLAPEEIMKRGAQVVIEPLFNYLTDESDIKGTYVKIYQTLKSIARESDIFHAHNLNLGKNPLVTLAMVNLCLEEGLNVVNHAHDFAEDREVNWNFYKRIIEDEFQEDLQQVLYPSVDNYQFAVLNSHDKKRLLEYGVNDSSVHLVPNPVSMNISTEANRENSSIWDALKISKEKILVTYPVRVIRRKNIGEFILLTSLLGDKANWVVTQPPKNPVEIEPYKKWKDFCKENNIAVCFEAGTKVDFEELLQISDVCITTSIKEGFGMVFMEPWLFNTPVLGRDIPMVTSDLRNSGVQYPVLYSEFLVEIDGIEQDFSSLPDDKQKEVILLVLNDSKYLEKVWQTNTFLNKFLNTIDKNIINQNKEIILQQYSLEKFAERLDGIYRRFTD